MINIAICFHSEADSNYLLKELKNCLSLRNETASIRSFSNLLYEDLYDFHPDILIFHINSNVDFLLSTVFQLKHRNPSLVSLYTGNMSLLTSEQDCFLQPAFPLDIHNRKSLWEHIHLAYAISIQKSDYYTYFKRPNYVSIPLDRILYFVSDGRKIHIVTGGSIHSFYARLDEVELQITQKSKYFVRIHKSYLVNTQYIKEYSKKVLRLHTGELLKISNQEYYLALSKACLPSAIFASSIDG